MNSAEIINVLGFMLGIALYGLLLAMAWRHKSKDRLPDMLLLLASLLGIIWNLGELISFVGRDMFGFSPPVLLMAAAFTALGFLPSVVVHSAETGSRHSRNLTYFAYGLSALGGVFHFYSAATGKGVPSFLALQILAVGATFLTIGFFALNFRKKLENKLTFIAALSVFVLAALHLSGGNENSNWFLELISHQASLPLIVAILVQDYRFAFADLFLKRALSLILLSGMVFSAYVFLIEPLTGFGDPAGSGVGSAGSAGLLLLVWISTALIYPALHRFSVWFIDRVVLKRGSFDALYQETVEDISGFEDIDQIVDILSDKLGESLSTGNAHWYLSKQRPADSQDGFVSTKPGMVDVSLPTSDAPFYSVVLEDFGAGRKLLSEEKDLIRRLSNVAARRIDRIRVAHLRCEQELKEEEYTKLTAEAQLTALRSQVNPHFLFNALSTIGYLIQTAPDSAFETLIKLTKLLRKVLRTKQEFCTLGEEIELIENYLEIEKTRFEERLEVIIEVPDELSQTIIPVLIVQPLVENAIKHGVSENEAGGKIVVSATGNPERDTVIISVFDSGAGTSSEIEKASPGIGLKNIRGRIESHYGDSASLELQPWERRGTVARLEIPQVFEPVREVTG